MNESQLVRTIKAHIERGDKAKDKAEQHYIAAGQHLKELKGQHSGSWAEWEELLKTKIGIGKSRASELMQIADGTKTAAEVTAATTERSKRHRALSPLRNGENAGTPEASAEVVRAEFAALDEDNTNEDEGSEVSEVGDAGPSAFTNREALLRYAGEAARLARPWRVAQIENDAELATAAQRASDAWGEIASALGDEEDGKDGCSYEGIIKKLVAREKRYARLRKKSDEQIKEHQREQQPAIDALAARLIELDRDVARGVLQALAIFGPCGAVEGVNFFSSQPFILALQDALADPPSCTNDSSNAADPEASAEAMKAKFADEDAKCAS